MDLLFPGTKYPKILPARFALRIASFPYGFPAFRAPNTPKFPRRASRAGLLHFPMVFASFGPQIPQNFPGALSAPDCFIFLLFFMLLGPKYPIIFPARFARRIASYPYGFCCFWVPNTPKFSRRASRAGSSHFPMVLLLSGPQTPQKSSGRASRDGLLDFL